MPREPALTLVARSAEEASQALASLCPTARVRSPAATCEVTIAGVAAGGITSVELTTARPLIISGERPFDGYWLTQVVSGQLSLRVHDERKVVAPASGPVLHDARGITEVNISQGSLIRHLSISAALLRAGADRCHGRPGPERPVLGSLGQADQPRAAMALELGAALLKGFMGTSPLSEVPSVAQDLQRSIAALVLHRPGDGGGDELAAIGRPPIAPGHVVRAIDFMHAYASRAIGLRDVAAAAGVSVRALQEGFQRFRSTTPMEYLRQHRMAMVHKALLDPDMPGSVSMLARRCGFVHLGEFASRYEAQFGELPSATLKRRVQ